MIYMLLWACLPKKSTSDGADAVQSVPTVEESKAPSYELVSSPQFAPEHRRPWPFTEWKTAKAYSFNRVSFGPGSTLFAYRDGEWNESITETKELSISQAQAALELNHRMGGNVNVSKCAFPRHAVVFFDAQDQPVGSVNICFECGDILVWPAYYDDETDLSFRFSMNEKTEMPIIFDYHEQTLPIWEDLLIKTVGLKAYQRAEP